MKLKDFEQLVSTVKFPKTWFMVKAHDTYPEMIAVLATMQVICTVTGEPTSVSSRKIIDRDVVEMFDKKEAIHFIYDHLRSLWIHELDEWFEVEGERVFYPHSKEKVA